MIDYSIYIRTLGKGGEKYQLLLKSIDSLTIKPKGVYVVLPFGYAKPKEQLGYEHFVYCEKGMLKQRIYAIDNASTEWVLLLDDDVEFESELISKYEEVIRHVHAEIVCSPLDSEIKLSLKNLFLSLLGQQTICFHDRNEYVKINRCGGYSILKSLHSDRIYLSQSGHGSHCFAKVSALKDIHFEDELWLEEYGYALPEDQVFYYKAFLRGHKIAVCSDSYVRHLDAKSTGKKERKNSLMLAKSRNFIIFWKEFIRARHSNTYDSILDGLAIAYRLSAEFILYVVPSALLNYQLSYIKNYLKGIKLGIKFNAEENRK